MESIEYTTFEEISYDLKRLNLEREIAAEELHNLGLEVKESFKPSHLISAAASAFQDYGVYYLIRKFFKKK